MTSSAAEAISSATQISVATSSRPPASGVPLQVDHGGHAGAPDGHVGDAPPPGAAEGVRDDHADRRRRGLFSSPARMRRAERSESSGSSAAVPSATLDRSTPALAQTKPCRVSLITQVAAAAQDRGPTPARTSASLAAGVAVIERDQPAFGLRDDLLRDHDHVAVAQRGPAGARRRDGTGDEPRPGRCRAPPRRCRSTGRILHTLSRRHRPPPGPAAAARSGELMTVGVTMQRTPSASTSRGAARVGDVHDERADPRRVQAGHAHHGGLGAELGHQPVGRTLEGGAGDDRRHGHHLVPARRQGVADARDGEQRADGDDGVRRADDDRSRASSSASMTPGAGRRRLGPLEADAADRHVVAEPHEVVLEADLGPGRPQRGSPRPG